MSGSVALVLHGHLPWVRGHGTHPMGEEWLYQAWLECYLPLIEVLQRVAAAGGRQVLTLSLSPVLAEQMADRELMVAFHGWLGRRLVDLEHTASRYGGADRERLRPVWAHHWRRLHHRLAQLEAGPLATGLAQPLAELADAGVIELLGGPATHPYLPLCDDEAVIRGQMADGLATTQRVLGRRPTGVWTPECGYRPRGGVADPGAPALGTHLDGTPRLARGEPELPGLEELWADAGATHLVMDGPTLARAAGAPERDWAATAGRPVPPGDPEATVDTPVRVGDSDVVAFGRNLAISYAVWSPVGGYPCDPWYRDFFATDLEGGFKSWRVTDRADPAKAPYDPLPAGERALAHADDFVGRCRAHLADRGDHAIVVAAYDAELFGHWWYEGPHWLETVLRRLLDDDALAPTSLAAHLRRHPPTTRLRLPESSWGRGKGHAAWVAPATRWAWQALRAAQARFAALAPGPARDVAWRQLTLAQASDWPFLINRDESARYATQRLWGHLADFDAACRGQRLAELAARDAPGGGHRPPAASPAAATSA